MQDFKTLLKKVATPICQQHGFVTATLLMDWHLIVGEKFAPLCSPEKIVFPAQKRNNGHLYVATSSAFAPELSYFEAVIIDKINKYFGYQAVQRLVIRHKPNPRPSPSLQAAPRMCEEDIEFIKDQIKDIDNPELKTALFNLGMGIFKK